MSPVTQYIVYPLIVGGILAVLSVTLKYIGKYFNRLNTTLVALDSTMQSFILEQEQIHSAQDKKIDILNTEVQIEKGIRIKHGEDIGRLYKKVGEHSTEIEVIKSKIR